MTGKFKDRYDAGQKLASALKEQLNSDELQNAVALALPRGGVPVAYEVAREFNIPLDVVVARKVGAPSNPEFAIGAISEGDASYFSTRVLTQLGIDSHTLDKLIDDERTELLRRIDEYRKGQRLPSLEGKTALLIDDGLATGATAMAALRFLVTLSPENIVFAAPVCAFDSSLEVEEMVDSLICGLRPHALQSVGLYYQDFGQTPDREVLKLLAQSERLV